MMKVWFKALISFGLLTILFAFLPWSDISTAAGRLSLNHWLLVLSFFVLGHLAGIAKWRLILNLGRAGLARCDAVRCYSAGLFANLYLPSIVGGDILRATLAAQVSRRREAVVLGSLVDRMGDVAALAMLVIAGALLTHNIMSGWSGALVLGTLFLALTSFAVSLPFISRRRLASWPSRFRRIVGRSLVGLRRMARQPRLASIAVSTALAIQTGFILLNAWIGYSVGIDVPLSVWFLVWPLAKFAGLLPVSLGGLGVRDATLGALLVTFGVPLAYGVMSSLIWQTIVIAGGLIAGATWWLTGHTCGATSDAQPNANYSPKAPHEYG